MDSRQRHSPLQPSGTSLTRDSTNVGADGQTTTEDLACLESAAREWRQEREVLLRRLEVAEREGPQRVRAAESRLHAAAVELQALRQSAESARARLEAELGSTKARLSEALRELSGSHAATEELRVTNAELRTILDATQWRLATLDEEKRRQQAEIEHLRQQHAAVAPRLAELAAAHESDLAAAQSRVADLQRAIEQRRAEHVAERQDLRAQLWSALADLDDRERLCRQLHDQLDTARAAHAAEVAGWRETASAREAALIAARDHLTEQLGAAQTALRAAGEQITVLEEHGASVAAQLAGHVCESQATEHRLNAELAAARQAVSDATGLLESTRSSLERRNASLEAELQQQNAVVEELRSAMERLRHERAQLEERSAEREQRLQSGLRASLQALQEELDEARRRAAEQARMTGEAEQRVRQLEGSVRERDAELGRLQAASERASAQSAELVRERDHLLQRIDALERQVTEIEAEHARRVASDDTLDAERTELRLRLNEATAVNAELERECARLKHDRGTGEDLRRLRTENARLEARILDLDHQRSDAVQRHSAAVAGYMVELNQRTEALHAREVEIQKLTEELALVKQTCDDAVSELLAQRQEQAALEQQLAELHAKAQPTSLSISTPKNAPGAAAARPATAPPPAEPAVEPRKRTTYSESVTGPVTLIHLDDNKALCDHVRAIVDQLPESRYINGLEAHQTGAPGTYVLAVNLLYRGADPLQAIMHFLTTDAYHQNVFAYCADGTHGFCFGPADFFSHPVEPNACVARLIESCGAIQRLLVVSESFNVVGALRDVLSRMRSSTSAALDLRQAIDLIPMVDPDVMLIDLLLPRGEGLRLVSRLRADPKTSEMPLGVLLASSMNAAEFRQHAMRAARERPLTPEELREALCSKLGIPRAAGTPIAVSVRPAAVHVA